MEIFGALFITFLVAYAGYAFRGWQDKNRASVERVTVTLGALAVTALSFVGSPTYAQSDTITFDLAPFFTSLNTYLPIFIGLFAVIGGIAGAMALAKFVIGAVVKAFSGAGAI